MTVDAETGACLHEYPDRGPWTCRKCGYKVPKDLVEKISDIDKKLRRGGSVAPNFNSGEDHGWRGPGQPRTWEREVSV